MKDTQQIKKDKILKDLFIGLFPIQALSAGLPAINTLLSGVIIGMSFGSVAMAAQGFVSTLTLLIAAIGTLFSSGSQLLCGQMVGKGEKQGISRVFNSTMISAAIIGLVFLLPCLFKADAAARILGSSGESFEQTCAFIRGLSFGFPFTIFNTCLLPYLQLDGEKKRATVSIVVLVIVNIACCLLNVFVFKFGMFGIGLAYSLSAIASFCVSIPHFIFKSKVFCFSFSSINFVTMIDVVKLGFPAGILPLLTVIKTRLLNEFLFIGLGTIGVSAYSAASNIASAIGNTMETGYCSSSLLISSILIGEKDCESLISLPRVAIKNSYYINLLLYALIVIFSQPLAVILGAASDEVALFVIALRLRNIYFITNPLKTITLGIYQSLGMVLFSTAMNIGNSLVFPPIIGLIALKTNPVILFGIPCLCETIILIILIFYHRFVSGKFPTSFYRLVHIPEKYYIHSENRIGESIHTSEEAVAASKRIYDFCLEKGLTKDISFRYSLCAEELLMDTLFHRVPLKTNTGDVDLRLLIDDGEITLIIRDNYKIFNINDWLEFHAEEDPVRSIGLKLVKKSAASIVQTTCIGLNVLLIKEYAKAD